jgi:hypothetical protein
VETFSKEMFEFGETRIAGGDKRVRAVVLVGLMETCGMQLNCTGNWFGDKG